MSERFIRSTARPGLPPDDDDEALASSGRTYQAMTVDPQNRRQPARLRIVAGDGVVSLLSYAFLSEVHCSSPTRMSLIYSHCAFSLEGRHLDHLIDKLQEDKVRALICFNPKHHDYPDDGTPLITRVTRLARKGPKEPGEQSPERLRSVEVAERS